ncbi:HYDROLASE ALPHA/BETA FOLD FAMILY [Salix purpurea]|uniref:HYDROLASE ALPHA/BETA FOLD FAMILY n=1 Tax=Salix purpurea TaxID=77065 RepID=A0A9Q0TGV2_SALPP|nr:HYDROLASE ALPHA/BETA FOLD FAMILY [Salix purpurea]
MATWALLSPIPPPPPASMPTSNINTSTKRIRVSSRRRRGGGALIIANATNSSQDNEEDSDAPAFNPFGFVTDNPSSRSSIQLPESPAEDGNVGQMLYRIEDKGKENGSYIKSGKLIWFVRETGSPDSRRGTVIFLHGAPTQSYSYRVVMSQMSDAGFHCFAPDWIGFGFSDKPQPGYGFDYTEKEFHEALDKLLDVLGVNSPFFLVVQGFLVGSYGLTWALKNKSKISKLAILNSPVTVSSPVPGLFQQLRIPLFGEFTCQNAVMAERFIEAGSPYVLKLEKADVYRLPYLASSGPGVWFVFNLFFDYCFKDLSLLEAARKINLRDIVSQIADGFASERWDKPILLAWGIADKYLPQSVAEEFKKGNPNAVKLKLIEGAGHMPQEDWPEKVVDALRVFF